nr:tetratricopeptide repeat protein [Chlorogloeopsis fritschii]
MPSHPKPSLKAGLTALKQEDYQKAKAILEEVATTASDRTEVVQAQIGLVVLYSRTGEEPKAIALCETLSQNERLQVKEWAETTLAQLRKRYQKSDSSTKDVTGFVPFENSSSHPTTGNREQGTGNREKGTGKREQGKGNREQGTGNREQGKGNREQRENHSPPLPHSPTPHHLHSSCF